MATLMLMFMLTTQTPSSLPTPPLTPSATETPVSNDARVNDAPTEAGDSEPNLEPSDGNNAFLQLPRPPERKPNTILWTSLGAGAGTLAALGISFLFVGPNGTQVFSNAILASLLATGVGFTVHQATGGRGEIILAYLGALAVSTASALVATLVSTDTRGTAAITTAIAVVPLSLTVSLLLEGTGSLNRRVRAW